MNKDNIIRLIKEIVAESYGEIIPTATLSISETDTCSIKVISILNDGIKLADDEIYNWDLLSVNEVQHIFKNIY